MYIPRIELIDRSIFEIVVRNHQLHHFKQPEGQNVCQHDQNSNQPVYAPGMKWMEWSAFQIIVRNHRCRKMSGHQRANFWASWPKVVLCFADSPNQYTHHVWSELSEHYFRQWPENTNFSHVLATTLPKLPQFVLSEDITNMYTKYEVA